MHVTSKITRVLAYNTFTLRVWSPWQSYLGDALEKVQHQQHDMFVNVTGFEKTRLPHTSDLMTLTNHNLLWQCTRKLKISDFIHIRYTNEMSKFQSSSKLPQ